MTKLEIAWTAEVLHTLVTDTPQRMKRGAELRKKMVAALEAGKKPGGYRPPWIHKSAMRVVETLSEIAKDFNDLHPADQTSVNDLLDILATAMEIVRGKEKKATPKAPEAPSGPRS